ncbi:hypothetical protein ABKN59_008187 [Abortiporus biennis]
MVLSIIYPVTSTGYSLNPRFRRYTEDPHLTFSCRPGNSNDWNLSESRTEYVYLSQAVERRGNPCSD